LLIEIRKVDGLSLRIGQTKAARTDSPPVLLFNGIGASLELIEPFAAAMQKIGITTIAFDAPGAGGSEVPVLPYRLSRLARLADHLLREMGVIGAVDVLGVSWGGALAQQFAYQYPERCRRLVLAATSAGAVMVPGKLKALSKMASPRRYVDREYMRKVGGQLYGGRLRNEPELMKNYAELLKPPSSRGYAWQLLAVTGWTSIFWLRRIRQETLVMMGRDDPIVPVVNGRILSSLIPNARLYTIDDGHLFLMARTAEVVPVIRDFLLESEVHAMTDTNRP
jgi:poly(3-hydroxyalkanoate) depolymerase